MADAANDMEILWDKLQQEINSIDEKMDSWNPETGQRRTFLKDLLESEKEKWSAQAEKLTEQLEAFEPEKRFALYLGLVGALNDSFKKESETWVDEQVSALPKPEKVVVSDEEKTATQKSRSETYAMMKQLRDLAQGFKFEYAESWELPKIRRGGSGKRGPRALTLFDYTVDGTPVEVGEDETAQAAVARVLGYEKSAEFTKALKEIGVVRDLDENKDVKINTSKPPKNFEVTLNGKNVVASRPDDDEDNGDGESEDDE